MRSLGAIVMLLLLQPVSSDACELRSLPVSGSQVQAGAAHVSLGEMDDAQHPSAWQGPLQVTPADGRTCVVSDEVAIVEQPLLLGNDRILFVPTYSGSTNRVYAVDLHDCQVVWKSPEFSGTTSHVGNVLVMAGRKRRLPLSCRP